MKYTVKALKGKDENGMFPLPDNSHLLSIDYKRKVITVQSYQQPPIMLFCLKISLQKLGFILLYLMTLLTRSQEAVNLPDRLALISAVHPY